MKNLIVLVCVSFMILSCKETPQEKTFIMKEQSEMAALMNLMYEENEKIKSKIINEETLDSFPEEFLNIHSAVLTDPSDRTNSFNTFSDAYIKNMEAIFIVTKDSLKTQFNQTINSCIACHKTTCTGPIPRIKKLIIQ